MAGQANAPGEPAFIIDEIPFAVVWGLVTGLNCRKRGCQGHEDQKGQGQYPNNHGNCGLIIGYGCLT